MKVIIAGSRSIDDYTVVTEAFTVSPFAQEATMIVSGNSRGVDRLGEQLANDWALSKAIFPANWNRHKQFAGILRNSIMADFADALIAVWDGKSPGTKHMIETMEKKGKPVFIYRINENQQHN